MKPLLIIVLTLLISISIQKQKGIVPALDLLKADNKVLLFGRTKSILFDKMKEIFIRHKVKPFKAVNIDTHEDKDDLLDQIGMED